MSHRWLLVTVTVLLATRTSVASDVVDFGAEVRPLLNDKCASCHGGIKKSAGLSVITRQSLLAPSTRSGQPVVIPGSSADSELMHRVSAEDPRRRMPLGKEPLSAQEIALLKRWIDAGAVWPTHWAYVPVEAPETASAANIHPIDHFIGQRLDEQSLKLSPPADRATLIRRLSLDLRGLLPTPAEVAAFTSDRAPDAYERLVEQFLGSPHYGERWARHWLDEARYADSEGYEKDSPKEDAFRYRDWVIQAINQDLPFDQFTIKQIAGDLLPAATSDDLIATKLHLQAQFNLEGGVDSEEDRTRRVIDQMTTIATVWMGMTIACCQCHDHPYDPLAQREFYELYAFFNNTDMAADFLGPAPPEADQRRQEREQKWSSLSAMLDQQVTDKNLSNKTQAALTQLRQFDNGQGFTRYLQERQENRRPTYLFQRGDFLRPLKDEGEIRAETPAVLPALDPRAETPDRLDLALWLVRPDHPLTARVTVNKVWLHLLGEPLALQPGDFGSRGAPPSHPELLDWLAQWFVEEAGWSRKALIRLIVTSKTYRQSSAVRPELHDVDPTNRLWARQNRYRLEAEVLRDTALQAGDLLSRKVGGPSVFPPLPEIIAQQTYAGNFKYRASQGAERYRRGLYTFFRRTAIDPNLSLFDCPDASMAKPERDRSNNALQALSLLQNEVYHEAAQAFAKRLLELDVGSAADRRRLEEAFLIALSRVPEPGEVAPLEELLKRARTYYRQQTEQAGQLIGSHAAPGVAADENAAWIATVRVILNLDEFVTRS